MRTRLLRVQINTQLIDDCLIIPIRDNDASIEWLLSEISTKYHEWHPFKIYEFEIDNKRYNENDKVLDILDDIFEIKVIESEKSKLQRKQDEEKEEELRLERLRIEREKREKREKRIKEITLKGNCWELTNYSQFLNVPLYEEENDGDNDEGDGDEDEGGQIVVNTGSLDQWCSIRFITAILPSFNKFYFSIKIVSLPSTSNTWKICIGAVPVEFKIEADRHWIGSQHSYSYIAGTGGKCYNSGKSLTYGEPYKENDIVSVLLNFENNTIEFFKNGKSQGIAFKNLKHAVIPAVSLTAKGCKLKILNLLNDKYLPSQYKPFMIKNVKIIQNYLYKRQYYLSNKFESLQTQTWKQHQINMLYPRFSSYHNPSSLYFNCSAVKTETFQDSICNIVTNVGSGDKWRIARSFGAYYPDDNDSDIVAFEFIILNDAKSSNTWRICCGIIPIEFDSTNDKIWVGAQSSYSYIAGTGGKCFNSSQSTSFGERYTTNDKISILLNFNDASIEFFKNGESQGVAFQNCECLKSGVYAAVSMTGSGSKIKFNSLTKEQAILLQENGIKQRRLLSQIMSEYGNIWDSNKLTVNDNAINIINKMEIETIMKPNHEDKKWYSIGSLLSYQSGRRYFEIELDSDLNLNGNGKSSQNEDWKICVGVVPKTFKFNHSKKKLWIGAQNSWSLILGNGQKCFNSKCTSYTKQQFNKNDKIGVLMDFDNHTLEFYKNDVSLGQAFNNLYGPVFAAVSIVNNIECKLNFRPHAENEKMDKLFLFK